MRFTLRDYQAVAVDDAARFFATASPGDRRLYAAPTGSGKSVIELALLSLIPGAWLITPRLEIVAGMLEKLGEDAPASPDALVSAAWQHRITTPIRLRNAMLRGDGPPVFFVILDECHHHNADTYAQLDLLSGVAPTVGLTATPYRGNPAGTRLFREAWGEPVWVLTYPAAVARGVIAFPSCEIVPLVDDDEIEVSNGEFSVRSAGEAVMSRLAAVAQLASAYYATAWDRATMFSAPDTESALALTEALLAAGLPARPVTQATSHAARADAFSACVSCVSALVQINVVSEGVDLPIRRLVDLAPMLSPVRWLQQFGRITRPVPTGEAPPHYVCTNRNLLRHAYLLEGCIPPATVAEAAKVFGGLGTRAASRAIGLEALGRLKGVEVPSRDGCPAVAYCVSSVSGAVVTEYTVIVHPARRDPLWARRTRTKALPGQPAKYGRWARCEAPDGLTGYTSVPPSPLSEKQAAWWARSAGRHGLDPTAKITRKQFPVLPVLSDLKETL